MKKSGKNNSYFLASKGGQNIHLMHIALLPMDSGEQYGAILAVFMITFGNKKQYFQSWLQLGNGFLELRVTRTEIPGLDKHFFSVKLLIFSYPSVLK